MKLWNKEWENGICFSFDYSNSKTSEAKANKIISNLPEMFCENSFSDLRKVHKKSPVLESLFQKNDRPSVQLYQKRDSNTGVFLWLLQDFVEHQERLLLKSNNIHRKIMSWNFPEKRFSRTLLGSWF